jgi:Flp pilus assembly protein TadB
MQVTLAVVFLAAGGFAITNLNSGIEARAERQTSEVVLAQRKLDTLTKAREAECKRRGPECRRLEREEQDAIAALGNAQITVRAEAAPQAAVLGISSTNLHLVQAGSIVALCLFSGLFISFGAGLVWPRAPALGSV